MNDRPEWVNMNVLKKVHEDRENCILRCLIIYTLHLILIGWLYQQGLGWEYLGHIDKKYILVQNFKFKTPRVYLRDLV
jgi:hypothetical protein